MRNFKRILLPAIKLLISIGILSWLFARAWRENQFQLLMSMEKNWLGLAAAFSACLMAHLISFFRWQLFVRAIGLPFTLMDAMRIGFIGLFFNLVAFGVIGGDSLRAYYITRQMRDRMPEAIASVVVDRFIGVLTMFTIAAIVFVAWNFSGNVIQDEAYGTIRTIGVIAIVGSVTGYTALLSMLLVPAISKSKWFQRAKTAPLVGRVLGEVAEVVLLYRSQAKWIVVGFGLSGFVNLCFMATIYLIASSITNTHPSLAAHFLIEPISMVANAVPLPGGIGGMEPVLSYLYKAYTVQSGTVDFGISVAFGFRFLLLLVSALGAWVWFANRRLIQQQLKGTGAFQASGSDSTTSA